jgi:O-antigen ligase
MSMLAAHPSAPARQAESASTHAVPQAVAGSVWVAFGTLLGLTLASWFASELSYLKIYYILMAGVFACAAGLCILRGYVPRALAKWGVAVFGLYAYFGFTALWALDPEHTLVLTAQDLLYPVIWFNAFLFARFTDARSVGWIFRGLPWAVALLFAYMLVRYGLIRPEDFTTASEIGALGNAGAITLLACLPYLAVRAIRGLPGGMLETVTAVLLLLVSQSRTGYLLGALLLCATVIALRPLGLRGMARVAGGVGAALSVGLVFLAISGASEGVEATLKRFTAFDSLVQGSGSGDPNAEIERITMYVEGFNAWRSHPWLGIGYENLEGYISARHGFGVASHNLLITLFAECGWPSVIIFGSFLYCFFRYTKRVCRLAIADDARDFMSASRVSTLGFLAISMVHPLFHQQMFLFVTGVALGLKTPLNALPDSTRGVKEFARRIVSQRQAVSCPLGAARPP